MDKVIWYAPRGWGPETAIARANDRLMQSSIDQLIEATHCTRRACEDSAREFLLWSVFGVICAVAYGWMSQHRFDALLVALGVAQWGCSAILFALACILERLPGQDGE